MAIEYVIGTPGSGMTFHLGFAKTEPVTTSIFLSLPCVCCGEDSVKDNLCQSCLDSLHKDLNQ